MCHDIVKVTVESTSHRRVISTANFDNFCKILSCIRFKPKWSQTMSDYQPGGCVNFKEEWVITCAGDEWSTDRGNYQLATKKDSPECH